LKKFGTWILAASILAALAGSSLPAVAGTTPTVGADGAVDGNLKWEQGQTSTWYIELQRYGLVLIQDGINKEHDADIRKGMLILDWGFAHQAADGSFAGSGDIFHSSSLFVEAAAQATTLIKSYKPVTYTKDATFYNAKVSAYSAALKAAAHYLITPSVATQGQQFDQPYTHRRYLLAAALIETASLTGDTTLAAPAAAYITAGLPLQITSGLKSIAYPQGMLSINMAGVNPEAGGYDVSYQMAGIRFCTLYYLHGGDNTLHSAMSNMMNLGLTWETSRIDVKGNIDTTGSTRIGTELNRDGTVKQLNTGEVLDAFNNGYHITHKEAFRVYARRVQVGKSIISTQAVAASGAVAGNSAYDTGASTTCSVDLQKLGTDYIAAGVDQEDASLISQGINMINWGFSREASDGSFPSTSSPFYTVGQFIEGAARATLLLKNYHPVTYSLSASTYGPTITNWTAGINAAAKWMMRPDIVSANTHLISVNTHRYYVTAAALGEAGVLCNDATMTSAAASYMNSGIAVQQSNGVNLENGIADPNYEAKGIQYAGYYLSSVTDPTMVTKVTTMMNKGLAWESPYIDVNGVAQVTNPSKSIPIAFALGYQATGVPLYGVIARRMGSL